MKSKDDILKEFCYLVECFPIRFKNRGHQWALRDYKKDIIKALSTILDEVEADNERLSEELRNIIWLFKNYNKASDDAKKMINQARIALAKHEEGK